MKSIIALIIIVLVAVLMGCGTGQTGQEVFLKDFNKIEILNGFHVDINVGEEYGVMLKVDEDILRDVEAVKEGDTCIIRVKPSHDIGRATTLSAEITLPALTGLTIKNGSHVTVNGSSDDVVFDISGGSHASLGDFVVENADLTVSGGSHVTVNVKGKLDVEVSGGSHVRYKGEPQLGDVNISAGSTFSK